MPIETGKKVAVYYNLNRGGWSIAEYKSPRCYGKVLGYAQSVTLTDCRCVVRESSRLTVIKDKRRQVHAWIVGTLVATDEAKPAQLESAVSYNPFKCGHFYPVGDETTEVSSAPKMFFSPNRKVYK